MPSKAYIRDYFRRKRQGGPWGRARFKKAGRRGRFKSKYGRKRKRVSVPKKRMRKKALVRSKFHYAPKDKEVPLTLVNDEPLILRKPPALLTAHKNIHQTDQGPRSSFGADGAEFLSGAAEPNFRFTADLGAVQQQIKPYLQLYKEFKITGVTIKFKPTWTKKGLMSALKQRFQTTHQDSVEARRIVSEVPARIPSGWYPRIYYRIPKFGEMADYRTMMPNQAIARELDASSKALFGPQTFKYVPKMYKNTFDTSGMPVTSIAGNVGWLPTDDAFKRQFGSMDFVISPYPNFDSLANQGLSTREGTTDDDPDTQELHNRFFGTAEFDTREGIRSLTKLYAEDYNTLNDQYVIVNRTYHILMRGRKTKYWNDEAWASGDYDVKPTDMKKIGWYHNKARIHEKTGLTIAAGKFQTDNNISVFPTQQHVSFPQFRDVTMAADTGMSREDARSVKKDAMRVTQERLDAALATLSNTRSDNLMDNAAGVMRSQGVILKTQLPAPGNTNPSFFTDPTDDVTMMDEVQNRDDQQQNTARGHTHINDPATSPIPPNMMGNPRGQEATHDDL